ncbi:MULTISPECIES: CoA transferase [Amycolatopsis methanolica group]|nr:CoA transferase [Amycolatopsis methanolica]
MHEEDVERGPLDGVRVVDLTTSLGAYTGRLLSDLGADVVRVDLDGDRLPRPGVFTEAGKARVTAGRAGLEDLLGTAQILLTSEGPAALRARDLHPEDVVRRHLGLVHVSVSPYGLTGPYADRPASDLTLLAAGGLLALAGDPDREPVRPWGEQSTVIAGAHAAVAALLALLTLEATGRGQVVDLSAQEAVAHSLENAVQCLDLEGVLRNRAGSGPLEAGTGLFRCADGWIYLVGGLGGRPLAWSAITEWLLDNGITEAEALRDERWGERSWRRSPDAATEFRSMFERFAVHRTKDELYEDGQRRGISIAPVATPADLLANPQLTERGFFREVTVDGRDLVFPGPPYRFAGSRVGPRSTPDRSGTDEGITA